MRHPVFARLTKETPVAEEMVIFTRCYDLLTWLLPKVDKFPRPFRTTVTQRMTDAALDLQEALFESQTQRDAQRLASLRRADAALAKLRLYLRLASNWRWLSLSQYEHVSAIVGEIGRLLGGWLRRTNP